MGEREGEGEASLSNGNAKVAAENRSELKSPMNAALTDNNKTRGGLDLEATPVTSRARGVVGTLSLVVNDRRDAILDAEPRIT